MKLQKTTKKNNQSLGKLYQFIDYKKRQPFFRKPIKILMGSPINETFYMVENIVYEGKQILALKQENNLNTIVLVEAKIEDGQLKQVSRISNEFLSEIQGMFKKQFKNNVFVETYCK